MDSTPRHEFNHRSESAPGARNSALRQLVESVVCLAVAVVLFRTFAVEGYMISTGSMAPTLLGFHKRVVCGRCNYEFGVGVDAQHLSGAFGNDPAGPEPGRAPVTAPRSTECPNCRETAIDISGSPYAEGDQLLVHKNAFQFHPPRRWDIAVFRNPNRPSQAYVKRVVGLPGEDVQIRGGDVWINGRVARKDLEAQRALRIPVYDFSCRASGDALADSRWSPETGASGWELVGDRLVFNNSQEAGGGSPAWIRYEHRTSGRGPGPVTDRYGYNSTDDSRRGVPVRDLMVALKVRIASGDGRLVVRMTDGVHVFDCQLDVAGGRMELTADGRPVAEGRGEVDPALLDEPFLWEVSLIDRQVLVALNGRRVLPPVPFHGGEFSERELRVPVRLGAEDLQVSVTSLRVFRDVYYRSDAPATVRHGIEEPFRLGEGEYFVLGDNSPVSSDSRCWLRAAVPEHLLLGKPFVVHLPSQPKRLRIGPWTSRVRVPDLSRIRYIR